MLRLAVSLLVVVAVALLAQEQQPAPTNGDPAVLATLDTERLELRQLLEAHQGKTEAAELPPYMQFEDGLFDDHWQVHKP